MEGQTETTETTTQPNDQGGGGMVPIERLNQARAQLRDAQAQVAQLTKDLQSKTSELEKAQGKAGAHDHLIESNKELTRQLEEQKAQHEQDMALIAKGFTDVDLLRFEHSRLGDDALDIVEWASKLTKSDAPPTLAQFVGEGEGTTDTAAQPKGTSRDVNAGAGNAANEVGNAADDESLRALIEKAQRTGDWSDYKRARGHTVD